MDRNKALIVLSSLANGINPNTGEIFESRSPYQTAEVVRALYVGIRAIEKKGVPLRAGQPWTEEEDGKLLQRFESGCTIQDIAALHERTLLGIEARLESHGRLLRQPCQQSKPS